MKRLESYWAKLGRRARLAVLISGVLLVVYLVVGFFVAGPVLRSVIAENLTAVLQRPTTVGKVSVNPVTFRVVVKDLAVAKKEGEGNLASFKGLDVRVHPLSVFRFAPVLAHLRLVQPSVDITFFGDGKFSISDLIPASDAEGGTAEENGAIIPFRVNNLLISNGTVTFQDMPHKATHVVSELDFSVPLTSTLGSDTTEYVEPSLKAKVNGRPITLSGKTKPFDKTLVTEFTFETEQIDLARYWEYVPAKTPLRLTSGMLSSKIMLAFSRPEGAPMKMDVSGLVTVTDVAVSASDTPKVAGFASLAVDVERFALFQNEVILRDVTLTGPYVKAARNSEGVLNWASYFPANHASAGNSGAEGAAKPETAQKSEKMLPFDVDAKRIAIAGGRIDWKDASVSGGYARQLAPMTLTVTDLSTRKGAKAGLAFKLGDKEHVAVKGKLSIVPVQAALDVSVAGVELPAYAAYLESVLPLKVDAGSLEAGLHALVSLEGAEPDVRVEQFGASLSGLALRKDGNKRPSIELGKLQVQGGSVDLAQRTVFVEQVALTAPEVRLIRYADGLDLVNLFAGGTKGGSPEEAVPAERGKFVEEKAWNAGVGEFRLAEGKVLFIDRTLSNRGGLRVSGMELTVKDASTDLGKPVPVSYSAYVGGGGRNSNIKPGRVRVDGTIRPQPFDMKVHVRHNNVPLAVLDPYVGEYTGLLLAGGVLNSDMHKQARLQAEAPEGAVGLAAEPLQFASKGTVRIDGLSLKDASDSSHVASFDRFEVLNFDVSSSESRLYVEEISLNNMQGDALVDKEGVLNISRLMHPVGKVAPKDGKDDAVETAAKPAGENGTGKAEQVSAAATPAPASSPVPTADPDAASSTEDSAVPAGGQQAAAVGGNDTVGADSYTSILPFNDVRIDRVRVNNAAFRFTDRSVAPAFSTALTELNARLDGVSLAADARPELDITAKLDNQALALKGVANPIINPMYSDLTFTLNGVDLVPLSPYSLRSVAYPIEKGRLYADVHFKTEDWVLDAKNKFFLEQLVMGEKDKRPDAPNIPVKLGLALLSDSSGNVEVDLPIKGRLDDPQFLTGGIVLKAFVNLIFKVVTSPFALIGNIVAGGGDDAQFSVFEAGSARLTEGQAKSLESVVEFLNKKSTLKLEIAGFVDQETDTKGMIDLGMHRRVQAAKYADMSRRERAAVAMEDVQISPEEYAEYLTDAYKDVPKMENDPRPSGVFGFKEVPLNEMESFLKSLTTVTPQDLTELAAARAKAVQDAVLHIDPALAPRVFLTGAGKKPMQKTGVPKHRVELGVK